MDEMSNRLLIHEEERRNLQYAMEKNPDAFTLNQAAVYSDEDFAPPDIPESERIALEQEANQSKAETLFEMICRLIRRFGEKYRLEEKTIEKNRKRAEKERRPLRIKDEYDVVRFYGDADITGSVWSSMKLGKNPRKKTLFKIIINLELSKYDAERLLKKAGYSDYSSHNDQKILQFIAQREYDSASNYLEDKRKYDDDDFEAKYNEIKNDIDKLKEEIEITNQEIDRMNEEFKNEEKKRMKKWNKKGQIKKKLKERIDRMNARIRELEDIKV